MKFATISAGPSTKCSTDELFSIRYFRAGVGIAHTHRGHIRVPSATPRTGRWCRARGHPRVRGANLTSFAHSILLTGGPIGYRLSRGKTSAGEIRKSEKTFSVIQNHALSDPYPLHCLQGTESHTSAIPCVELCRGAPVLWRSQSSLNRRYTGPVWHQG